MVGEFIKQVEGRKRAAMTELKFNGSDRTMGPKQSQIFHKYVVKGTKGGFCKIEENSTNKPETAGFLDIY